MQAILLPSNIVNPYKHNKFSQVWTTDNQLSNFIDGSETTKGYLGFGAAPADLKLTGYKSSSLPGKYIVNGLKAKIIVGASSNCGESIFQLVTTNERVLKELVVTSYPHSYQVEYDLSIPDELAQTLTQEDISNLGMVFQCTGTVPGSASRADGYYSSITLDYTPLTEYRACATEFITPFKHTAMPVNRNESYGWPIWNTFCLIGEAQASAEIIYPHGAVGDGYFCGFDISGIPQYAPIFEAILKVNITSHCGTRVLNRKFYAYSSDAKLCEIAQPDAKGICTISIPKPTRELLQDIRLVVEGNGTGINDFDNYSGVELYVVYGDPLYSYIPGYASTVTRIDSVNQYSWFTDLYKCSDEPDTLDTYATVEHGATQSHRNSAWYLQKFKYEGVGPKSKIIGLRLRASFSASATNYYPSFGFEVYCGNTLVKATENYSIREADFVYSISVDCGEVNLKYSDIENLQVKVKYGDAWIYNGRENRIYGLALDVLASTDATRPEWYPIVETLVTNNNYTRDNDAAKPSKDISINDIPDTDGFIGNLYNDDLEDYAEFGYEPKPDENGVMPEDKPEFETVDLGVIRIDGPELSSLGIPENAVITNIKLTKESLKHCSKTDVSAELSLYINDNKYNTRGFDISTNFVKTTYNTGKISIPKLEIRNDKPYFMLKWNSLNTPFTFKVRYLLWDITYEIGGLSYSIQFAQSNIDKIIVGQTEVVAIYAGNTKIYG